MIHAEGCTGGQLRQSYHRGVSPRRYCGNCGRLQGRRPEALTARQPADLRDAGPIGRSLIQRALDRLRLS